MNIWHRARRALAAAAVLVLAGCMEPDNSVTYDRPLADLQAAMLKIPLPPLVFGSERPNYQMLQAPGKMVEWRLTSNSRPMMRLVATLEAVDAKRTKVAVAVLEPTEKQLAEKGVKGADALIEMYRVAMSEQIDAKLRGRDYDPTVTTVYMQRAAAANMSTFADSMERESIESAKKARAMVLKAYEEERTGARTLNYYRDELRR